MSGDCIAKVTPSLNETFGENNWKVDIKDPEKILIVSSENDVKKSLEKVSYTAEEIKS